MAKQTAAEGGGVNPWRLAGWGVAVALLLLPLAAMQFTHDVKWTPSDFVVAGLLIGGVGVAFELAVRATNNPFYRAGAGAALAAGLLLIWINGAVGIIGDEDNPLNLLYGGVLAVALGGAIGAGFRARGMSRAMIAAAVATLLVGVVAVIAGRNEPPGPFGLALINAFFVALFLGSARLFREAAGKDEAAVPSN